MLRDEIDGKVIPPRSAFALTFEGPRAPILKQAMYQMSHAELGDISLFLSPFRQDASCALYESVFN